MTPKSLLIVAVLLAIAPVQALYAQDERTEGDKPHATVRTQDGGREATGPVIGNAVERSAPTPRPAPAAPTVPRVETRAASAPTPSAPAAAEDQRRRQRDDGGRDRGDSPAVGRAVPRDSRPAPAPAPQSRAGGNDSRYRGGANVYVAPRAYNYYYYPRRYYPYGYGAFGLGYFYYDPYTWYPPSYSSGYYGGGYYDPFYGDSFFHDVGELRISVSPRYADVYVDGYFSGRVDDYDGTFQALKLEAGPHHIQIVAPGFAPLDFDVRIEPGRKITYRGALQPFRP